MAQGVNQEYIGFVGPYCEAAETQCSFVNEWVRQDVPVEDKGGTSFAKATQEALDATFSSLPPTADHLVKQPPTKAPQLPPAAAPPRYNVLVFQDSHGFCKGILEQAPDGRLGKRTIVEAPWDQYGPEEIASLVGKKGWDMIIFGASMDIPRSNSVEDIIDFQDMVTKVLLDLVRYLIINDNPTPKLCVLTRGCWAEDPQLHKDVGLSLVTMSLIYGFCNTARQELQACDVHCIDTEYFLKQPFWSAADNDLLPRLSSEVVRSCTFGQETVRILHEGRYINRLVSTKPYAKAEREFSLPDPGDIVAIAGGNGALGVVMGNWLVNTAKKAKRGGFEIQFLSRSAKIGDVNIPLWQATLAVAAKLGIKCEQMQCDMSNQEAVDRYVLSTEGRLQGFIHSAGVLADQMIMNVKWEHFDKCWTPKHRMALWLHDSLERLPHKLEYLWLFSSTAVYGNMGQLNYSASNSMLDGLSRHRNALGKRTVTWQWGAWGEAGMATTLDPASKRRMMMSPMPPFSNAEGLAGMEEGIRTGCPTVQVVKMNSQIMVQAVYAGPNTKTCFFRNTYSEMFPTPPPVADNEHLYETFRTVQFPYMGPDGEKRIYNTYVKPYLENVDEEEDGDGPVGVSLASLRR